MAYTATKHPGAGHPWDGRAGFDHLEIAADTQAEMDAVVAAASQKFWQPWLIGTNEHGAHGGVMYKPSGILTEWHDSPENPHPGATLKKPKSTSLTM